MELSQPQLGARYFLAPVRAFVSQTSQTFDQLLGSCCAILANMLGGYVYGDTCNYCYRNHPTIFLVWFLLNPRSHKVVALRSIALTILCLKGICPSLRRRGHNCCWFTGTTIITILFQINPLTLHDNRLAISISLFSIVSLLTTVNCCLPTGLTVLWSPTTITELLRQHPHHKASLLQLSLSCRILFGTDILLKVSALDSAL